MGDLMIAVIGAIIVGISSTCLMHYIVAVAMMLAIARRGADAQVSPILENLGHHTVRNSVGIVAGLAGLAILSFLPANTIIVVKWIALTGFSLVVMVVLYARSLKKKLIRLGSLNRSDFSSI